MISFIWNRIQPPSLRPGPGHGALLTAVGRVGPTAKSTRVICMGKFFLYKILAFHAILTISIFFLTLTFFGLDLERPLATARLESDLHINQKVALHHLRGARVSKDVI